MSGTRSSADGDGDDDEVRSAVDDGVTTSSFLESFIFWNNPFVMLPPPLGDGHRRLLRITMEACRGGGGTSFARVVAKAPRRRNDPPVTSFSPPPWLILCDLAVIV